MKWKDKKSKNIKARKDLKNNAFKRMNLSNRKISLSFSLSGLLPLTIVGSGIVNKKRIKL